MCRFLMVKSSAPRRPRDLLRAFADMAERSRAVDGDRQGDGWGVSWLGTSGEWEGYWSLRPVWEETEAFDLIPASPMSLVHARSATNPGQKGKLDYNQPFIGPKRAFVFNGLLRGVSFRRPLGGEIGAQKIWNLGEELAQGDPSRDSLPFLVRILERSSREISALNLGIADAGGFSVYCRSAGPGDYYRLRICEAPGLNMVCSEPLAGYDFRPLPVDTVLRF